MNSRILMATSALFLAGAGLVASFAPQEMLAFLGSSATGPMPVLVQLLGALYFSFALLNWTAKDNIIGGIYSRPISIGNLAHFLMGALALGKSQSAGLGNKVTLGLLIIYALFAVLFGLLVFGRGKNPNDPSIRTGS